MSAKLFKYDDHALDSLTEGINLVYKPVAATYGPGGRNVVMMGANFGYPITTKDGATVAKGVDVADLPVMAGAQLIKTAALRTNEIAGDGTSTTTILTKHLVDQLREANFQRPHKVKKICSKIAKKCAAFIQEVTDYVDPQDRDTLIQIATISANDAELGEIVGDAWHKVGKEGHVSFEISNTEKTSIELIAGYSLDRGYETSVFVNNPTKKEFVGQDPLVIVTDREILADSEILPMLDSLNAYKRPIIIVAERVDHDALQTMTKNHQKGHIVCCAVRAPGHPGNRKELLEDLCHFLGCKMISRDTGMTLDKVAGVSDFIGQAKNVVISEDRTIFSGGGGDVSERISTLLAQTSDAENEQVSALKERVAALNGKTANIRIGALTFADKVERRYRFEDAIHSVRTALQRGVVGGGASIFPYLALELTKVVPEDDLELEVLNVFSNTFKLIYFVYLENMGLTKDKCQEVWEEVLSKQYPYSYSLDEEKIIDMVDVKVLDSALVATTAIDSAANIAGVVMLTTAVIYDDFDFMLRTLKQ